MIHGVAVPEVGVVVVVVVLGREAHEQLEAETRAPDGVHVPGGVARRHRQREELLPRRRIRLKRIMKKFGATTY